MREVSSLTYRAGRLQPKATQKLRNSLDFKRF